MNFAALLAYVCIAAFTPGPNNIMAMTNSIKYGFSKTMIFCLGVFVGFLVDMSLCALGTSFLYEYIPTIQPIMRWIGAGYILLLAVVVFRDKGEGVAEGESAGSVGLVTGVIMQLVNVKVILYGITAMSTFILPHYRSLGALILAILFLSVFGLAATSSWALFGSMFQGFYGRNRKAVNSVMALLLVYCAVGTVYG